MNTGMVEAANNLIEIVREESSYEDVSFDLFVNCYGYNIRINSRTPEDLKRQGISVKNLKGEFIK